jgi:hypothetical protein
MNTSITKVVSTILSTNTSLLFSILYELIEIENNVSNMSNISEIFEKSQVSFLASTPTTRKHKRCVGCGRITLFHIFCRSSFISNLNM